MTNTTNIFRDLKLCVVIPTYNNEKTLADVVENVQKFCPTVMVVNDGSTDSTPLILNQLGEDVIKIQYKENRGKGYAMKLAFRQALAFGYDYVLTMDADGQHRATDLEKFADFIRKSPDTLIIGSRGMAVDNMPKKNTFANRFSNFWFYVQTFRHLPDTQSGFRVYPLQKMGKMHWMTTRYETELEILVRCAWKGVKLLPIPIDVYYPPKEERVSHFRPRADFFRISLLNTVFCLMALVYGYPSMLIRKIFKKR